MFCQPDEPYDFEFVNASTPCHGVVSIPWTEKNHVEMAVTHPRANKTVSTLLLALTRRDAAGDFVLIYWLVILQMLEHLRLVRGTISITYIPPRPPLVTSIPPLSPSLASSPISIPHLYPSPHSYITIPNLHPPRF